MTTLFKVQPATVLCYVCEHTMLVADNYTNGAVIYSCMNVNCAECLTRYVAVRPTIEMEKL